MPYRLDIFLVLVLMLAGCNRQPYSRSTSGFSSTDKKLLYDFRGYSPTGDAKLDPAATRKVLSIAFPSYLSEDGHCTPGAVTPKRAQIDPTVRGTAEGSFTAPGARQTAYLINVGECAQDPALTTRRLVVLTAGAVNANVGVPFGDAILGTYDLDGNGKDELLLEGGGFGQGERIHTATLLAFDKDKLITMEDFGRVYDDTCGTTLPSESVTASVVYYLPPPAGQKPRFTVELYRAACSTDGREKHWERTPGK